MNLNTIHRKATNLRKDLAALQDGSWVPDEDSIEASLDASIAIEASFSLLQELASLMSDTMEWLETGQVDGVPVDREALLAEFCALNEKFTV